MSVALVFMSSALVFVITAQGINPSLALMARVLKFLGHI